MRVTFEGSSYVESDYGTLLTACLEILLDEMKSMPHHDPEKVKQVREQINAGTGGHPEDTAILHLAKTLSEAVVQGIIGKITGKPFGGLGFRC